MRELKSLLEMVKGRWREFVREPSAFFFVVLMPVLWMAILGYGIGNPRPEHYDVGWRMDQTGGAVPELAHEALRHDARVRLQEGGAAELATALRRGSVLLVLSATPAGIRIAYDPANREAAHARMAVASLIQEAVGRRDVMTIAEDVVAVPGTRYIDFLVPGLVALSIMTTSLFGTGAVLVVSRRENLLKRYMATPMRPMAYILSHVIGRFFMLAAELAVVLVAGLALFDFHVAGSLVAFVVVAATGAATFTALAMLCASRTANMAVMNGMTNLISLPMMIVAGVWFARTNFPEWTWGILRALPLTALVDALRKVALEGAGLPQVGFELGVMGIYFVLTALGARVLFKWY